MIAEAGSEKILAFLEYLIGDKMGIYKKRWSFNIGYLKTKDFSQKGIHMTHKYMKRCLTSLDIRQMHSKSRETSLHPLGWLESK